MGSLIDITGQRYGMVTVLEYRGLDSANKSTWLCRCDCGNEFVCRSNALRSGNTKSCGCVARRKASERLSSHLEGQRFGMLLVLSRYDSNHNNHVRWLCKCDCGLETVVETGALLTGNTTSCGCKVNRPGGFLDLRGRRFHRLLVTEYAYGANQTNYWKCTCDCGKTDIVLSAGQLCSGGVKSCGCLRDEKAAARFRTHGLSDTRIYNIWQSMKGRCDNPDDDTGEMYWSVGITYEDDWVEFMPFYEWAMSHGYRDDLTIDRINPFIGYSRDNCRFLSKEEQPLNQRHQYLDRAKYSMHYAASAYIPEGYDGELDEYIKSRYSDSYFSKIFAQITFDILDPDDCDRMDEFLAVHCTAIVLLESIYFLTHTMHQNAETSPYIVNAISTCDSLNTQFLANNWPLPAFQSKEG